MRERKRVNPTSVARAIELAQNGDRPPAIQSLEREIANAEQEATNPPSVEDMKRITALRLRLDELMNEWRIQQASH